MYICLQKGPFSFRRTKDVVGLGLGVTVGAGVFMATGKASEEAGPAPWTPGTHQKQWDNHIGKIGTINPNV